MPPTPASFESSHLTKSAKSSLYLFWTYGARSSFTRGPMCVSQETMTTFSSRSIPVAVSVMCSFPLAAAAELGSGLVGHDATAAFGSALRSGSRGRLTHCRLVLHLARALLHPGHTVGVALHDADDAAADVVRV